jgi:ligand-binding sensor domain-containing protein
MKTLHATRRFAAHVPLVVAVALLAPAMQSRAEDSKAFPLPIIERFENFSLESGIPSKKVHSVLKTSDGKLWIGTWDGLCLREENGKFKRYGPEHGLSHKMVLSLVEDPRTGDLWIGTMRGLNRFSAGKITTYTQTSSGLPNNVVYGVDILDDTVWAATAAGAGALNLKTGVWKLYDHSNTPMHEPWCYTVKATPERVFIGAWGGGIVESDTQKGSFKDYRDPDRDFHYDLAPDDGPINDITSWLAFEDGILWQTTYFGVSRYDFARGRWKTWVEGKSPLISNFTQFVWARKNVAWIGTDKGVCVTDGTYWANYLVDEQGAELIELHRPGQPVEKRFLSTSPAHHFVLGIWADDKEAWFATSKGLSRAVLTPTPSATKVAEAR